MAELDLATYEQIATLLSQLMTNYNAIIDNYYNMFYSTTPGDITITLYDESGVPKEYVIPNRAKDFNYIKNGQGSPEGNVIASVGTMYQDILNGVLYIKNSGTGNTGWVEVPINTNIEEGYGSPEGVLTRAKGTLYIDKDSAALYIKTTSTGNTGWNLISVSTSSGANIDLSNLSPAGEDHFVNKSLSNLNENGQQVLEGKANSNLDNLTSTGESHFANPSLSNLNAAGKAQIAIKQYSSDVAFSTNDVVLYVSLDGSVKLYKSLVANNIGNSLDDPTKWAEIQLGGSSRTIGEIVTSTVPVSDAALHLADGSLIPGAGIYAGFVSYIADLYDGGEVPECFTDESSWQVSVNTYGTCDKYVYDSSNSTVRLPKRYSAERYLIKAYNSGQEWYRIYSDGWCEQGATFNNSSYDTDISIPLLINFVDTNYSIKPGAGVTGSVVDSGHVVNYIFGTQTTGGFQAVVVDVNGNTQNNKITWEACGYTDISNYETNPLYEYIVLATTEKTDIEVDIDEVVADLNGKADKDLSNITNTARTMLAGANLPDYANKIVIASGVISSEQSYTVPADGYIFYVAMAGLTTEEYIEVDGLKLCSLKTVSMQDSVRGNGFIPVSQGSVVKYIASYSSNSDFNLYFVPFKS